MLLPLVADQPNDQKLQEIFGRIRSQGRSVPDLYRVLGHSPEFCNAWAEFASSLRHDSVVPRRYRELAIMRLACASGDRYNWVHHYEMAIAAGVEASQLQLLADWPAAITEFDYLEQAILQTVDAVLYRQVTDQSAVGAIIGAFSVAGAVELLITICFYICVGSLVSCLQVDVESVFSAVPIP
jgi:4-carboxymuconolactone decarboxylase